MKAVRPEDLVPIELDPLTVANDKDFFDRIKQQQNLPAYIKSKLEQLYNG
jgi:hypothetical protein